VPEGRIAVIYNGVDPGTGIFAPTDARDELGAAPGDVVVLVAARMVPEKGHRLLLDVFAGMNPTFPHVKLWLAGDGPELHNITRQIETLGLRDAVQVLGFREDVPRLLRAADVLCHPSRREGAPNIVLEAMAAALPVVSVHASGTAELVVHGQTGLLSAADDAGALRANLESVLGDDGLRSRLGRAGRARVLAEFTEERSVSRWERLLSEVVRERHG
jgi:glycosyltransferase involved in cell wall biosynthesis